MLETLYFRLDSHLERLENIIFSWVSVLSRLGSGKYKFV